MKLQVRDKEFDITFVNNYVRERYRHILSLSDDLVDLQDELKGVLEKDIPKSEQRREKRKIERKRTDIIDSIGMARDDIVKEIIETNDYEYDENWWSHRTDANDVNGFILDCIMKDVKEESTKKK